MSIHILPLNFLLNIVKFWFFIVENKIKLYQKILMDDDKCNNID